ncbi:hypothetical protein DPMN_153349 [Dreissena polymorpha]|uniref:Uncharacterized protein n=1 Tax=Dreissena polymorpha TaxID=45954 RepID=A0A9D4FJ75_DREPO|nr:hypothetical protein DPMN_153349 [Dreissena polymorpha]
MLWNNPVANIAAFNCFHKQMTPHDISATNRTMMKILDSLDVASSKSLDKKQLANILKDTMDKNQKGNMYKVLFPNRKWEDTFQKHLQEGKNQIKIF